MSPINPFPARPAARPATQPAQDRGQSAWQGQQPVDPSTQQGWQQQQPYGQPAYNQGYGAGQAPAPYQPAAPASDPYAPQFEPYPNQPARALPQPSYQAAQPQPYGQQGQAGYGYGVAQPAAQPQWGAPQADPHGFDGGAFGGYGQAPHGYAEQLDPHAQDWHLQGNAGYGHDPYQPNGADNGFAQASGGELEAGYEEDEGEYEDDVPRRGPRFMMMAAALAGAIIVGGSMAYGYRTLFGGGADGEPPVIKSASEPSKTKPADGGGKQFDYADRKIMGRLGEGSAAGATGATPAAASVDENGTRKVSTLVVGRDGSIQAPPEAPASESHGVPGTAVAVPGMTVVDAFGAAGRKAEAAPPPAPEPPAAQPQKVVVSPPAESKPEVPVAVTKVNSAAAQPQTSSGDGNSATASEPDDQPAKKVKMAAAYDDAAPAAPVTSSGSASGISGYVAVLASVPKSATSRMDALKRFADIQQKHASVLTGKTPDVAEANLGSKGNYHRLVVGPPGSREQASTICTQLKSEGFADCWVAPY